MLSNMLRWLPAFRDLDHEQQEAVNQSLDKGGNLIYGPAGSGKTAITLFRAKTLADQKYSVILFVFTNALLKFIAAGAQELRLPSGIVQSVYKWVFAKHRSEFGRYPPDVADKFDIAVDNLIQHWTTNPASRPHYDYVLVDEAQDFKPNVARLLHMLTPNLLIAADPAQSLYMETKDLDELTERWRPLGGLVVVAHNYRNPRPVAQVAALFVENADDFLANVKGRLISTKPVWYEVKSRQEVLEQIHTIVETMRGEKRIGILVRHRNEAYQLKSALDGLGIRTQVALSGADNDYDFNSTFPVITTVHSAKGLEFDWVILPDLNAGTWDENAADPAERRLFFVALTRSKEQLFLISIAGTACKYLQEIETKGANLLQRPLLTVRTYGSNMPKVTDEDSPF